MTPGAPHTFVLGGVVYVDSARPLPGTGACPRTYYRWFYCTACLAKRHERLPVFEAHTYLPVLYNATPEREENIRQEQT